MGEMSSFALMPEDGSERDSKSRRFNVAGVTTALNRGHDGDPTNDPTLRWDDEDGREISDLRCVLVPAGERDRRRRGHCG